MKIWLIRHGETEYNKEHRYQGRHDIPLSDEGKARLAPCYENIDTVYVSPLKRAVQTAQIIFPRAKLIRVPGLAEMNFGVFEGHTFEELGSYPPYQAWVDSGGKAQIPGGESREQFSSRVKSALSDLMARAAEESPDEQPPELQASAESPDGQLPELQVSEGTQEGQAAALRSQQEAGRKMEHDKRLVIVAHGGTIMAAMEWLGKPGGMYFEWLPPNGTGYEIDTDDPDAMRRLDFTVPCN